MARVGVWASALEELGNQDGTDHEMSGSVTFGIYLGIFLALFEVFKCGMDGCSVRGITWVTVVIGGVFACLAYNWYPSILLLGKNIKFALRAYANKKVTGAFKSVGEKTCLVST
jgi:hypothetical protein